MDAELHRRCANTIKGLAMDGVQQANSGHPGMPMGMADIATVLFSRYLRFDPQHPEWADRDRFVLSNGHGSMLLYSMLHLCGYDLPLDELKRFRQWDSRTPGHPEYGHTAGVETTTGPLGQGIANAVGMAMSERMLRETFGPELCDHFTYVFCGDGCLMEGISSEAASVAGHLGLGRLILLWDDNHISIDGDTALAFTEDVGARFEAQGWHVQKIDGHDRDAIARAIDSARAASDRPSLIACRTIIANGSSLAGSEKSHGAPLGVEEIKRTKERLGMDPEATFAVPAEVAAAFRGAARPDLREAWEGRVAAHPEGEKFRSWWKPDWKAVVDRIAWPTFAPGKGLATRKANAACLKAIIAEAPYFVGGSADLAESNGVEIGRKAMTRERFAGTGNVHFGVREHAMGAIVNGIAYHGGLRAFGATFLVFHDYQRPAVRLSALAHLPVTHVYTHDSVLLGEDGPTHQPIDTLLALRCVPGLDVWRPADSNETVLAWKEILRRTDGPSALVLTRQDLPHIDPAKFPADGLAKGGYVLVDTDGAPHVVLLATGSEVALCVDAAALLLAKGIRARVVSLPNRERFWAQDLEWRRSILPRGVARVAVEAGCTLGWERYVGDHGTILGIDRFGASAPAKILAKEFGFTAENVAATAERVL